MRLRIVFERIRGRRSSRDVEQLTSETKREAAGLRLAGNLSGASSSTSLVQLVDKRHSGLSLLNDRLQQLQVEDDHPTTLHYGFGLLSKMLNTCILYIPAFALNLRFGSRPSRTFVMLSYLLMLASTIGGIHLSSLILEPSNQMFVGRMNSSLKRICLVSAAIGQVGYISYSMITCAYILYQRQFLQNLIYHSCSIITLARSYQRRQVVSLFIALNLFAFLAEPLFGLLVLSSDFRRPAYWPQFQAATFELAKWLTFLGYGLGAGAISSGTVIIPLMTCFLISASTKHLNNLVQKQSSRCRRTAIWELTTHSDRLLALLDSKTRAIMEDFACETLTMDWPMMADNSDIERDSQTPHSDSAQTGQSMSSANEENPQVSSQLVSANWFAASSKSGDILGEIGSRNPDLSSDLTSGKLNSSQASSLLFLYKNLIKSLSELKCVIVDYERRFGNFHQIISLLSCLIVSLWVTSVFTEVRRGQLNAAGLNNSSAGLVEADDQRGPNQTGTATPTTTITKGNEYQERKVAHTVRIVCCTLAFVLSNVYTFLKCDKLSDRIIKIKSQLFKMNIDLAGTLISAQERHNRELIRELAIRQAGPIRPVIRIQSETPDTGVSIVSVSSSKEDLSSTRPSRRLNRFSGSVYEIDHWKRDVSRARLEFQANQCSELDQLWSLYDQVTRISAKVNFKFTSDTYYSKKCMLLVFGRAVSLVLFFIQIIDMYSS